MIEQLIAIGAALSAFTAGAQHKRLLRIDFPRDDGPDAILLVNTMVAREEVSRCFRFDVELLSDDARIPLKVMMGRMVTIYLVRDDGSLRYFNGYVTEFRFVRSDGGFAFYKMILEPWLAIWASRPLALPVAFDVSFCLVCTRPASRCLKQTQFDKSRHKMSMNARGVGNDPAACGPDQPSRRA